MTELSETLALCESMMDHADALAPEVSSWSVGQHLEHILIVASGFAVALASGRRPAPERRTSDAAEREQRYSKQSVLVHGRIPRGTIKVPPAGEPSGALDSNALRRLLAKTESRLERSRQVPETTLAYHPLMGELTRNEVFRFLEVHTRHHLVIIDEILAEHAR